MPITNNHSANMLSVKVFSFFENSRIPRKNDNTIPTFKTVTINFIQNSPAKDLAITFTAWIVNIKTFIGLVIADFRTNLKKSVYVCDRKRKVGWFYKPEMRSNKNSLGFDFFISLYILSSFAVFRWSLPGKFFKCRVKRWLGVKSYFVQNFEYG